MKKLLYLHIPFCDSKCHYCAFNSYVDKNHLKKSYVDALIEDLKYQFDFFNIEKKSFYTLFIGGGTPSVLGLNSYEKIFNFINPFLADNIEITTEINPTAKEEWLIGIKELGVNRVSVGVQSFNDNKLKFLGRNHSSKKAIKTLTQIQKVGFDNVSLDLIYDVKNDNKELLKNDISIAKEMSITHLSSYSLSIEKNTPFSATPLVKLNDISLAYWWLDIIKQNGFLAYEISNFAKKDKFQSKHNKGYWEYLEYVGAGSGAIGCVGDTRYQGHKDIEKYISNYKDKKLEKIQEKDKKLEKIFMGLRSNIGVDLSIFNKHELSKIEILLNDKKITQENSKIYNLDYIIADEIVSFIY